MLVLAKKKWKQYIMRKSEAGQSIWGVYFVTATSFLKGGAACEDLLKSQQMATRLDEGKNERGIGNGSQQYLLACGRHWLDL